MNERYGQFLGYIDADRAKITGDFLSGNDRYTGPNGIHNLINEKGINDADARIIRSSSREIPSTYDLAA